MPGKQELSNYYDGFLFAADPKTLPAIENSTSLLMEYLDIPSENSRMLDIGGGGGHYSFAFEKLNYGQACYIDLDPQSCAYARSLGLRNVIQGDVEDKSLINGKYDLIFARHLIEHLPNPTDFMTTLSTYLKPNGKLVVICPNGQSTEYRFFPTQFFSKMLQILISNRLSFRALSCYLRKAVHHGIAPPRHLWAITKTGLESFWNQTNQVCETRTLSITDPMVSPHFRKTLLSPLYKNLKKHFLQEGKEAHLMCIVQNTQSTPFMER